VSIDIHHHMLPPHLAAALAGHGVHAIGGEPVPAWEPRASLDIMDRSGIARAVLSAPIPLHFLDRKAAAAMASDTNRFAADCTRRWPSRFGYFASLPLPDVSAATAEAVSALDQHGAAGVTMLSNHAGLYQGDRQLDPLYEELDKRRAVAFIHPAVFTAGRYPTQPSDGSPVPGIQPSQFEFAFDTTRTVANLLVNQIDPRFPGIQFVFTHSAACVPSVLHKLLDRKPMIDAYTTHIRDHGTPPPVEDLLQQLHTAEAEPASESAGFTLTQHSPPPRQSSTPSPRSRPPPTSCWGTDFPFGQEIGLRYTLDGIRNYPRFSDDDRTRVLTANAQSLLART
jgi:predicted TIM-barrel fold metal-dependent hydrolase